MFRLLLESIVPDTESDIRRMTDQRTPQPEFPEECQSAFPGVLPAPVFRPTLEEFQDAHGFLWKVRGLVKQYGLCKVVPPPGWKPGFALGPECKFKTRTQDLPQLGHKALLDSEFKKKLRKVLQTLNRSVDNVKVCGHNVNLRLLFYTVRVFGGYESVSRKKRWGEVVLELFPDIPKESLDEAVTSLRSSYLNLLRPYEIQLEIMAAAQMQKNNHNKRNRGSTPQPESNAKKARSISALENKCSKCEGTGRLLESNTCKKCRKLYHLFCLTPPQSTVESNWKCLQCKADDGNCYGYGDGETYSVTSFKEFAQKEENRYFPDGQLISMSGSEKSLAIEKKYWDLVNCDFDSDEDDDYGEVEYGNDLETIHYGSGFRQDQPEYWNSSWNVFRLPESGRSLLRMLGLGPISGVNKPWICRFDHAALTYNSLDFGMVFSTFAWHCEDHDLYSINYVHFGASKRWYGVPSTDAHKFEQIFQEYAPELFEQQPDIMYQLVTMIPPHVFTSRGVRIYSTVQKAGEFVITFPRVFHCGFNEGFNAAEAVNFALEDWLPHGVACSQRYQNFRLDQCFSVELLLLKLAEFNISPETASWIAPSLQHIVNTEEILRYKNFNDGLRTFKKVGELEPFLNCCICNKILYFSKVQCSCTLRLSCLAHAELLCECSAVEKSIVYYLSIADLEDLQEKCSTLAENFEDVVQDCKEALQFSSTPRERNADVFFMAQAKQWAQAVDKILKNSDLHVYEVVYDLLTSSEQFLWAGHLVDFVRNRLEELTKLFDKLKAEVEDTKQGISEAKKVKSPKTNRRKMVNGL